MRKRRWNDEQLRQAVVTSFCLSQVIIKLGLALSASHYRPLRKRITELGISTEHFTGSAHMRGKPGVRRYAYELKDILVKNSFHDNTASLKKRLYKEGLLKEECSICGLKDKWESKKLILQLDHKNGDRSDNRIENLQILCPNCHSQTKTYTGRNRINEGSVAQLADGNSLRKSKVPVRIRPDPPIPTDVTQERQCSYCNKVFKGLSKKFCSADCYQKSLPKTNRPDKEYLTSLIRTASISEISKRYDVSDTAVRKWLRRYKIDYPPYRKGFRTKETGNDYVI